jgi:hypothetical protein
MYANPFLIPCLLFPLFYSLLAYCRYDLLGLSVRIRCRCTQRTEGTCVTQQVHVAAVRTICYTACATPRPLLHICMQCPMPQHPNSLHFNVFSLSFPPLRRSPPRAAPLAALASGTTERLVPPLQLSRNLTSRVSRSKCCCPHVIYKPK